MNIFADSGDVDGHLITISKPSQELPAGYIKLEYVESTGEQYIDTGFKPNQDTRIVIDADFAARNVTQGLFGHSTSLSSNRYEFLEVSTKFYSPYNNGAGSSFNLSDSRILIDKNKNTTSVNGTVVVTHTYATFQAPGSMYLFARFYNGGVSSKCYAKVYSCKIYDNGTVVRDYVPAMNANGIAGLYDKVNDVFYSSLGENFIYDESAAEQVIATQTSVTGTYKIPFNTSYAIGASDVSGFVTPSVQTFIAEQGERTVNVVYQKTHTGTTNPVNGIYIQDTDGYFHTEAEWDGSYTPNGVAVITSNCRFVIALEDASTGYCEWGSYGTLVNGITTTDVGVTARTDYDGEAQTTTILNQLGNSSSTSDAPAAYYCRAYIFPNGKKGYLGAVGEWWDVLNNETAINSALSKCGGTSIGDRFWTSTQCNLYNSWFITFTSDFIDYTSKYNSTNSVRAFAAI